MHGLRRLCLPAITLALTGTSAEAQFPVRLWQAVGHDWNTPAYTPPDSNAAPAPRRGLSAPFDSPPYWTGEWQLGGSPQIGDPNTLPTYPLMKALDGSGESWLKRSGIHLWGWLDIGANASTSKTTNVPAAYNIRPDHVEIDQAVLYIQRTPDEAQTDHIDWGFLVANLYGLDYRFTTMKGVFSSQLLRHNDTYGYDPVMVYGDLYLPKIAQGMNLRFGRYISLPDIEAQLAPNNPMYTHSILYTYDPFTQVGIMSSTKLSKNWLVQVGLSAGNDAAPWTSDAKLTPTVCVQWIGSNNKDSVYPCVNSINDGKYAYNNLQDFVATWAHKFDERWSTGTEAWYMYEKDVPNIAGNVANPITPEVGANGAFCNPGQRTCVAPEWAIVNYTEYRVSGNTVLSIRNEYFDDIRGQRTGFKTKYTEHAVGISFWPNKLTTFRPEVRYEHSYDLFAYDGGTKPNQFLASVDVIFRY